MITYQYDGSFEGLLSVVFQIFADKTYPNTIVDEAHSQMALLDQPRNIATDDDHAERVLRGIDQRCEGQASSLVYKMFLSELPQVEMSVFRLIKTIMDSHRQVDHRQQDILGNFANPYIAEALRINKMIGREVHRMHAFVRFQKSARRIFHAAINPDFNVLPLIGHHFEKRYADQSWVILDTKRQYALYYDLTATGFIDADHPIFHELNQTAESAVQDVEEGLYQQFWISYFDSVNIKERKNTKLHLRHMPRRYWRYLTEKSHQLRQ